MTAPQWKRNTKAVFHADMMSTLSLISFSSDWCFLLKNVGGQPGQPVKDPSMFYVIVYVKKRCSFRFLKLWHPFQIYNSFHSLHWAHWASPRILEALWSVYSVRRFRLGRQIEGEGRKSPPSRVRWNIVHLRWVGLNQISLTPNALYLLFICICVVIYLFCNHHQVI